MQTTSHWSPPDIDELWGLTRGDEHIEDWMIMWANTAYALAECGVDNHNLYITYQVLRCHTNPYDIDIIGSENNRQLYARPFWVFFEDFISNEENKARLTNVVGNFLNAGHQLPADIRWELGFD
jgi:hypothetical protein